MQKLIRTLRACLILFPLAIVLLERYGVDRNWQLVALVASLAITLKPSRNRSFYLMASLLLALSGAMFFLASDKLARLYPFSVAFSVFISFYVSYQGDRTLLTSHVMRFVALSEPKQRFLHKMLLPWLVVLGINSLILFVMLFAFSTAIWAFYSSVMSYALLLSMFVVTVWLGQRYEKRYTLHTNKKHQDTICE